MSNTSITSRTRLGAAAGLLGVAVALAAVTGAGPMPSVFQLSGATEDLSGNCDEVEHAADPACAGTLTASGADDSSTSSTFDTSTTPSTVGQVPAGGDVRTVSAGDAGSVMVAIDGTALRLLVASPSQGWQVEVERASGREVEVTFRSGPQRVDVNVELEDGQIRERVRVRNDATGDDTRIENGVVSGDDRSGPSDDSNDDSSGPGSGDDDRSGSSSDDDSSGHGGDDDSSGHGGDDGPDHD
jgi:hypothetical protein